MSAGEQVRDFMQAEDAAAAMAAVALATRAPGILNICSGTPTSVRDLVKRWRTAMAVDIELNLGALPYPAYEPFAFWGDNRRLRELLGPPSAGGTPTPVGAYGAGNGRYAVNARRLTDREMGQSANQTSF
jgi:hypothetical protein